MAKRTQVLGGKKRRRRSKKRGQFKLDIKEDHLSVQLDQRTIAEALAAEASDLLQEGMRTSTRRLKRSSKERRRRKGIAHNQFWKQTGQLIREAHFQPSAGGAEVVVTRPLNGRQMGMALTDAGLKGRKKQETVSAMERRILRRLLSTSEADERRDDQQLATLIRRNKKGRV